MKYWAGVPGNTRTALRILATKSLYFCFEYGLLVNNINDYNDYSNNRNVLVSVHTSKTSKMATLTDYRGHCQTVVPVWELIWKHANQTEIIWHTSGGWTQAMLVTCAHRQASYFANNYFVSLLGSLLFLWNMQWNCVLSAGELSSSLSTHWEGS